MNEALHTEYFRRLSRTFSFIEENIFTQIEQVKIAECSGTSLYHFHRMFKAVTGDSLGDYIRKRKMSIAGKKIRVNNGGENKQKIPMFWSEFMTKKLSEEFDSIIIEAGTWAVFTSKGPFPEAIQNCWDYIYSEWLPGSGYELRDSPEIELYDDRCSNDPQEMDIYLPVQKKN